MPQPIRLLCVEGLPAAVQPWCTVLSQGGFEPSIQVVATEPELAAALRTPGWELVLCGHPVLGCPVLAALQQTRLAGIDVPFIIIAEQEGGEFLVDALRAGATDFVSRGNLGRLLPAVTRGLQEAAERRLRRDAEATVRLHERCFSAIAQGLLITDPNQPENPLVYVSPAFERITGYSPAEVLGRNCRFLQGKETDPSVVREMRHAIRQGRDCAVELLNYRKDGTPFWNNLTIVPVKDEAGRLTHFVGVMTDVTERRRLEEQYRHAQKLENVGQLAGGMAHDFNNLLTVVTGYSEMLLQNLPPNDQHRTCIEEIHKAGERGTKLTKQLLTFSRK
jgi:PAS domain S-box-containing protein